MGELGRDQEPLVRPDPPGAALQLGELVPQAPFRQIGERGRIGPAGDQPGEHLAARRAEDVGRHRAELDVGALGRLLQAVRLGRPLLHQRCAVPGQLAQLLLGAVGHELVGSSPCRSRSAIHSQSRTSVFSRHRLDLPRVRQAQLEAALQEVPDRLPQAPSRGIRRIVEDDVVPELLEAAEVVAGEPPSSEAIEVVGAKVAEGVPSRRMW